jgi:tetratricopeptide (TPR) repeat protein
VRRAGIYVVGIALLAGACGPRPPAGSFVYEGRRGDTLAALSGRFDDAALRKTLASETGRDPAAPFEAGERISIPFEKLGGHDEALEAFIAVHDARARRARGDYAAAIAGLAAVHAARPDDPALAFELGATLYEAGDYAAAAAAFDAARKTAPNDEEVILYAALAAAEAADVTTASAVLEELAAGRPDFPYCRYVLGEILITAGEYVAGRHQLFEYLKSADPALTGRYARERIKESARAEMAAAARALTEAAKEEEATPAREAGPAE